MAEELAETTPSVMEDENISSLMTSLNTPHGEEEVNSSLVHSSDENRHIHKIDMEALLHTLEQIETQFLSISPTYVAPWAAKTSLTTRLEALESKLMDLRTEEALQGGNASDLTERALHKFTAELFDQISSLRVVIGSEINLVSSGLNRSDKLLRSRPSTTSMMKQIFLAHQSRIETEHILEDLRRIVSIEAEDEFWEMVDILMERLKSNEDFSVKAINKIVAKLDKHGNEIERLRQVVESTTRETDFRSIESMKVFSQSLKLKEELIKKEDEMKTEIEEVVEEANFALETSNENFIDFRDMTNERVEDMEETVTLTTEEFKEERMLQGQRNSEMLQFMKDLTNEIQELLGKHRESNSDFPGLAKEKKEYMDEIRHGQMDSRSSVESFVSKCKDVTLSAMYRAHDLQINQFTDQYHNDEKFLKENDATLDEISQLLAEQIRIMEVFPEHIDTIEKGTASLSGELKDVESAMSSLTKVCNETITQVEDLNSIHEEAETLRATVTDRETRVKRVRAELSAIEQSVDDNTGLLKSIRDEQAQMQRDAQNKLSQLRELLNSDLESKNKAIEDAVRKIQRDMDDLVGTSDQDDDMTDEMGGGGPGGGKESHIRIDVNAPPTRQDELLQRQHHNAEMIGVLCIEYQDKCQRKNSTPFLDGELAEKTAINTMLAVDIMAESADIDVMYELAATPGMHIPATNIEALRSNKMDDFVDEVKEFVLQINKLRRSKAGEVQHGNHPDIIPIRHESMNKFLTLLRITLNMYMRKHEYVLVEEDILPEELAKLPKCIACDRLLPISDEHLQARNFDVQERPVVDSGNFPSFGSQFQNQGQLMVARANGGVYKKKVRKAKTGKIEPIVTSASMTSLHDDRGSYVLKSGFKMPTNK